MDTISERIELVIKALGITKSEFARRLKMGPSSVTKLCKGINKPSEQTVMVICKEFNVREEWLKNGTGEMFNQTPANAIDEMAESHGLSPDFAAIVKRLMKLPPDVQDQIVEAVFSIVDDKKNKPSEED